MSKSKRRYVYYVGLSILVVSILTITMVTVLSPKEQSAEGVENQGFLKANPQRVMRDERFNLKVTGLQPGQRIMIQAREVDDIGVIWQSQVEYVVNADGTVDLDQQKPVAGSFSESDTMALIMSMEAQNPGSEAEFAKKNFHPIRTRITLKANDEILDSITVWRMIQSEDVVQKSLNEGDLVGVFFYPEQGGPHPTILVLGGYDGGYEDKRAAVLASHGYAVLALSYMKMAHLPEELSEIPLEYFERALDWLKRQPQVDPNRIGITGVSMGANLTLLLASRYPDFRAVVAINGGNFVWQSMEMQGLRFADTSCWTYQGQPLPYIPYASPPSLFVSFLTSKLFRTPFAPISMYTQALETTSPEIIEAATIPIERINGPVLFTSGEYNSILPEHQFAQILEKRFQEKDFPFYYEHLHLKGVGHLVADPFSPVNFITKNWELREAEGSPEANQAASQERWFALVEFFEEHLKNAEPANR